jgi:hypothetical protein
MEVVKAILARGDLSRIHVAPARARWIQGLGFQFRITVMGD